MQMKTRQVFPDVKQKNNATSDGKSKSFVRIFQEDVYILFYRHQEANFVVQIICDPKYQTLVFR